MIIMSSWRCYYSSLKLCPSQDEWKKASTTYEEFFGYNALKHCSKFVFKEDFILAVDELEQISLSNVEFFIKMPSSE